MTTTLTIDELERSAERELGTSSWRTITQERIGGYKYPREIRIVSDVPLTPVGKVDRKALRALVS